MTAVAAAPAAWMIARAAGLVAFGLLTLSVWLGLAMSTRLLGARRQKPLLAAHRTLSAMGVSALGLHAGALLLDPVIHFGALAVLVPFAAPWRPVAIAAGVVAGWLMVALIASFRLRHRIGQRAWRRLHYASFAAFVLAMVHAITAGTDLAGAGGRVLALVAGAPVLWLTLVRFLTPPAPRSASARPGILAQRSTP